MPPDNPDRHQLLEAIEMLVSRPTLFLRKSFLCDKVDTPYTNYILTGVSSIFAAELILRFYFGLPNTQTVATLLFIYEPEVAWLLAPFLHKGVLHFSANMVFIYLASPLERHLSKWGYAALFVLSGVLPVYAEGAKLEILATETHVASYGVSGFAFGLLGFGTFALFKCEFELSPRYWLIQLGAVAAVILVGLNLATSVTNPVALNLAHLGGLLVGLLFGFVKVRSSN